MKKASFILALALLFSTLADGQEMLKVSNGNSFDVFVPIGKYLSSGDVESLSAWFAPTLDISIPGSHNDCSRKQAKQIIKSFFRTHTPRSFEITHQAGRENQKYALGNLTASGEHFAVTIFVSRSANSSFYIQQLNIERMD